MCDSEDKNLTSTMINNYVKHKVIPAPVKKKYEKEHLANLTIVCIAKQILSLSEIQSMMQQLCVLGSIEQIYDDFCAVLENRLGSMFGTKTCEKNLQTETQSILDALVGAFVNKLYLQRLIQDAEQLDMKKAD